MSISTWIRIVHYPSKSKKITISGVLSQNVWQSNNFSPFRFLLILLPCDDLYLRSAASQRPTYGVAGFENLDLAIETELLHLIERYPMLLVSI